MIFLTSLSACLTVFLLPTGNGYSELDLFQEFFNRDSPDDTLSGPKFDDYGLTFPNPAQQQPEVKDYPSFESRRDSLLAHEPSIRDQEYLEHSSLFGAQSMQGGAGEGHQRLRPDGSIPNVEVVKSDNLPAYCNPANPCPLGYTADDGCLEEFSNTPEFSREYQAAQNCMCDSEHMFDCPGATRENEIDALARSFENEGLAETALNRLMQNMEIRSDHKVVAKKFFSHKPKNPFLQGEKLPVVAKKAPLMSMK